MPTNRSTDRSTTPTNREDTREIHFDDRYLAFGSWEDDFIIYSASSDDKILIEPENTSKRTERTPI
jgi:hypothetical protein